MYKQIYKVLLVIFVLVPIHAFGQNAAKGFQLLKQDKHGDAIEVFNKAISKKKDILPSKFGLALIYSDTTYKRYRYSRAYKHIVYIEKRYIKLGESEKVGLRKEFNIDDISIGKLRLKILNEALAEAKKEGTVESLNKFRLDFPNTEQSKNAILSASDLAFQEAKGENNPEALIEFIRKYPNASEVDSAKILLAEFEEEAFKIYTSEGELESILEFEKLYPLYKDTVNLKKVKKIAEIAYRLELNDIYYPNMEELYLDFVKKSAPSELAYVALIRTLTPFLNNKQWSTAIERITNFKNLFPDNKKLDTLISILQKQEREIVVESISNNINTRGHEYAPVITADGKTIYFCGRHRVGNIGNEDIFVSKIDSGKWKKPKLLNSINTPLGYEAPLAISADGNRMLIYRNSNIYYSDKTLTGWSVPRPFPSINGKNSWEADAMTTADGNAILFISDRKGNVGRHHKNGELFHGSSMGNTDIYVSIRTNSGWSRPINLGLKVNTPYCERSPFLHPDMKTLYFSSNGYAGLGRLDVFKVERLNENSWTEWSEPINLGKEVNTPNNDYDFKFSTDGKYAFIPLFKTGNFDIYTMELPKNTRPEYVAIVSGFITNKKGDPVQAKIKWENLKTGEIIGYSQSDLVDGSYLIILPLGKNYGYFIDHQDYYPLSGNIDLSEQEEQIEIRKDFVLLSYVEIINEKIPIPLENVFFEFNKYELKSESHSELNRLVKFINKNEGMKLEIGGHTDNVGTAEYNKKLSQQRAKAVVAYLLEKGIEKSQLIAVGYGETKPIETNDTEEGKAKNRRVEFKVLEK